MYVIIQFEKSTASLVTYKFSTHSDNIVSVTESGIINENKYLIHDPKLNLIFLKTSTDWVNLTRF
jgi:hypothetical protein